MTLPRFECPHCDCKFIRDRGVLKYANDVQCFRCCRWYLYVPPKEDRQ